MKKTFEKPLLLDTNVLVPLADRGHEHHRRAMDWFLEKHKSGFATCPLTQLGMLRVLTTPLPAREALAFAEAQRFLSWIISLREHEFWPDSITALDIDVSSLRGHQQWNDAYLLALARKHKGAVATFDKGMLNLAGKNSQLVELIR